MKLSGHPPRRLSLDQFLPPPLPFLSLQPSLLSRFLSPFPLVLFFLHSRLCSSLPCHLFSFFSLLFCLNAGQLLFALLDSDTRRPFAMSDGFFKFALTFDLLMNILFNTSIRQPKDTEKNISPLDRRRRQGQALGSTSCTVLFRDSVLPFRMDRRRAPTLRG